MEQIYTIPVNEAFEKVRDEGGMCPFCVMYNKLEANELDLILGASAMEPDVRIRTNELGFCDTHFGLMFKRSKRLPLALMMESLLSEGVSKDMDGSMGIKGIVTDAPLPEHDFFYTCGPLPMMRAVCKTLEGPGELSMEERMGCGAGFCYGCTIQTAGGPARVCADGPVFKKEDILW